MTRARLFLSGIEATGHHGARPGEKDRTQPFVVDLDLEVTVGEDRIDGTADYRVVTERVRAVVEEGSFDLIESMAEAVARECLTFDRVLRATVVVHKPHAAGRLGIAGAAAAVTLPEA
ncbi:MAG TPA: dihydroneopterin aldolase [Actinomycetota bacterium]|nr:dihydroneopterin aldolase [Actinomycetota bacterium]